MSTTFSLGQHYEAFIAGQLAKGRYSDANEVIRDALRLMEQRDERVAALDAAIQRGLADVDAGRVHDLDEVFDELETGLAALPETSHA